jgi:diaminopimelate decarboxylase
MSRHPRIILSGCHAGPNPSPGLGTARSLRLAHPEVVLIAKDHSTLASGLHDEVFDEVWLCPPWDELDLERHWREIERRLEEGWFISGLDLETAWLANSPHRRSLVPPLCAIEQTSKPDIPAARHLPVGRPAWVSASAGHRQLEAFCRAAGWRVWVKGRNHEARLARSWPEVLRAIDELGERWGGDDLFLETHVEGFEESLAFAALEGRLLGSVYLNKNAVSDLGKAWGGTIAEPPEALKAAVEARLAELGWTGGGELECIRDERGALWLLDWNPRFPAWIHGATLAGVNLPGMLIEAASGQTAKSPRRVATQFIRTVIEVPVRDGLELPPPQLKPRTEALDGKHPSGMPQLARKTRGPRSRLQSTEPPLAAELQAGLRDALSALGETPARVFLPRTAKNRFALVARLAASAGVRVAYSVKTNPAPELMALAWRHGFLAETISEEEVKWAMGCGFRPGEVVYNGPVPWRGSAALRAAFADSVASLSDYLCRGAAKTIGVRLRPASVRSRFGVEVGCPAEREALVGAFRAAPAAARLGVSMHVPETGLGLSRWMAVASSVLEVAAALERQSGRSLTVLDLGGGWASDTIGEEWGKRLAALVAGAKGRFSRLEETLIEPGRCLAEPCQALLTRVVEVRTQQGGTREVVVDASLGDVPTSASSPHGIAVHRNGTFQPIGRGGDRLLGRSCMEGDILADDLDLQGLQPGKVLAVCDVGAYDASMAYSFGRGGHASCTCNALRRGSANETERNHVTLRVNRRNSVATGK